MCRDGDGTDRRHGSRSPARPTAHARNGGRPARCQPRGNAGRGACCRRMVAPIVVHLHRHRRRHVRGPADQRRRAGHQRGARTGRRERRGSGHLLHDQHDHAPEPGCADHEVLRSRELGDRQLRLRPGEHRRRVLPAQRPELVRPRSVGVVAALPRRHVLRRLQHQQPRWGVPLPHGRHRGRRLAAHTTRSWSPRPVPLLRRRRHPVHLLRIRRHERRTAQRRPDGHRAGLPEHLHGEQLRGAAVHRRSVRGRPVLPHRRLVLRRDHHLAVRAGTPGCHASLQGCSGVTPPPVV